MSASNSTETEMGRRQREYLLRQQLAAIQEELGEKSPEQSEAEALRQRLAAADLPDEVRQETERELAGVTMVTALTALYTKCPARSDTAMTGEVTLTGLVLPIGGVKEKVLAARRAGIRRVILPKANEGDLRELPDNVRAEMEFILASQIKEVLVAAIPELAKGLMVAQAA
jgi:ATP-dependent Lon protease